MRHLVQVEGETAVYHAIMDRKTGDTSPAERHFCPKYALAFCSHVLCSRISSDSCRCCVAASVAMIRVQVRQRAVAVRQPLARAHPPAGRLTDS
jgi:hypothetical protein